MDAEDIEALGILAKVGHTPALKRTYWLHRKGRNGDYMATIEIHDAGPHEEHGRFTCVAWRDDLPTKRTSSNEFRTIEEAILTVRWSDLD